MLNSKKKTITIVLEAHGNEFINNKKCLDIPCIRLLSFTGVAGTYGIAKICDNGVSVDNNMLSLMQQIYNHYGKDTSNVKAETQYNIYNDKIFNDPEDGKTKCKINKYLKNIYDTCPIDLGNISFKYTKPNRERTFIFSPNTHENHNEKCKRRGDKECIEEKNPAKRAVSYYGIYVAATTDINDFNYTLAGVTKDINVANIHYLQKQLYNNYWYKKGITWIEEQAKFGIKEYSDSVDNLKKIFTQIYEKMIYTKIAYSSMGITTYAQITLSQLYMFFYLMGFTRILIYDPTCRNCVDSNANYYSKDNDIKGKQTRKLFLTTKSLNQFNCNGTPCEDETFDDFIKECPDDVPQHTGIHYTDKSSQLEYNNFLTWFPIIGNLFKNGSMSYRMFENGVNIDADVNVYTEEKNITMDDLKYIHADPRFIQNNKEGTEFIIAKDDQEMIPINEDIINSYNQECDKEGCGYSCDKSPKGGKKYKNYKKHKKSKRHKKSKKSKI